METWIDNTLIGGDDWGGIGIRFESYGIVSHQLKRGRRQFSRVDLLGDYYAKKSIKEPSFAA